MQTTCAHHSNNKQQREETTTCAAWLRTSSKLSPLIHERFAALVLHHVLHSLAEGVGLAFPWGVEARVRRRDGVGAADQPESNGESGDLGAHINYWFCNRQMCVAAVVVAAAVETTGVMLEGGWEKGRLWCGVGGPGAVRAGRGALGLERGVVINLCPCWTPRRTALVRAACP